jgi:hypothetical protein
MQKSFLLFPIALSVLAQPPGGRGPGRGPGGGDGIWMRNAVLAESPTFDPCNAHQPPTGEYHYHDNPVCLRLQLQDNIRKDGSRYVEQPAPWHHSPILGWAYDGNPIYGPYGFVNPKDGASRVTRMKSGFHLRDLRQRHSLAPWAAALHGVDAKLWESQYGPDVDSAHPIGWYVEDYEFIVGTEELDVYNGRFTVTPEFPNGTYAYFVTIDDKGNPAFPYVLGRQYYGSVPAGQTRVTAGQIEDVAGKKTSDPELNSWLTKYNSEDAHVIDGHRAEAGPVSTWPGQNKPSHPDVSEVLYSTDWVYVSGSGLASHTMGPWYDPDGSVFNNWPRDQGFQDRFPRQTKPAEVKTTNMLGPLGRWVNGVALFNMLDGASWSQEQRSDAMGGGPGGTGGRGPGRGGRGGGRGGRPQ